MKAPIPESCVTKWWHGPDGAPEETKVSQLTRNQINNFGISIAGPARLIKESVYVTCRKITT